MSANELALPADWAAAAAPGNVAHVSEGRGSAGAVEGPAGDPGRLHLFEERPNFHISLRTAD